jgi:hypothetical protein
MLPLKHSRYFFVAGWLLLALVIFGSLSSGVPSMTAGISDKLQHFTGYFAVMVWFSGMYPRERHWLLALAFALLGAALEVAQGAFTVTRVMDFKDLIANCCGILAGLLLARLGLSNWCLWVENLWAGLFPRRRRP